MPDNSLFPMHEMAPNDMNSVDDFLEAHPEFLAPYADKSIHDMKTNYKYFSAFIKEQGITLGQVDQRTVIAYQKYVTASGVSVNTYAQRISHVRTLLKFIGKHFVYRARKRTPYANVRIIDEGDFKKIMLHIKSKLEDTGHRFHLNYLRDFIMYKVFYMTGLRKSEVLGLRHGDVFQEGNETYYQAIVKGGKQVKKQFPNTLVPYLRELKSKEKKCDSDFIFSGNSNGKTREDGRMAPNSVNKRLNTYYQRVIKKPGRITVHGIRNISGLAVQKEDQDIYVTRDHLNHQRLHTTIDYLEQVAKRTRTPLSKLDKRLGV